MHVDIVRGASLKSTYSYFALRLRDRDLLRVDVTLRVRVRVRLAVALLLAAAAAGGLYAHCSPATTLRPLAPPSWMK